MFSYDQLAPVAAPLRDTEHALNECAYHVSALYPDTSAESTVEDALQWAESAAAHAASLVEALKALRAND